MFNTDYELVRKEVEPLVDGLGLKLVELKVGRTKKKEEITVIIYKEGGVSLNHCADLAREISSRLELLEDFGNPALRVMSPGLDRVLQGEKEYSIFTNRGIKIRTKDDQQFEGIIQQADQNWVTLKKGDDLKRINIDHIKKAKLDYKQEVQ